MRKFVPYIAVTAALLVAGCYDDQVAAAEDPMAPRDYTHVVASSPVFDGETCTIDVRAVSTTQGEEGLRSVTVHRRIRGLSPLHVEPQYNRCVISQVGQPVQVADLVVFDR